MSCRHYWDATDIPGICSCICGASRMYDRTKDRYIVTDWNEKQEEEDEMGECDTCQKPYELASRWNRCGECGDCGECCEHAKEWEAVNV